MRYPLKLIELLETEPNSIDFEKEMRRLRAAGVQELTLEGPEDRPLTLSWHGPGLVGYADIVWEESDSPVGVAIISSATDLLKFDLLRRLHSALWDMEMAGDAAADLAPYHHEIGGEEDPVQGPLAALSEVIEAGIVTLYTRNYTGNARLPGRWEPEEEYRALHNQLMDMRHSVVAHADRTDARTLVNTNAMLGLDGTVLAEQRSRISGENLRRIAELCKRQAARFYEETWHLKKELGIPVADMRCTSCGRDPERGEDVERTWRIQMERGQDVRLCPECLA
jgi:hypothetical protein